jgi:hypothetical protein
MAPTPDDSAAADRSGGSEHPKDAPTPHGVTAPTRDAEGNPVEPGARDEEPFTPEAAEAVDTELADADSIRAGGPEPRRPAPTPERR